MSACAGVNLCMFSMDTESRRTIPGGLLGCRIGKGKNETCAEERGSHMSGARPASDLWT